MSQALRKLVGTISKSRTIVIFINQLREKIGVMFGNPETTTGGRALKFYSSVRMEIRRTESIKNGDEIKGIRARVKVVKNKLAAPFRDAEVDILYGRGISKSASILDVASTMGVIARSGAWFTYGEIRLGQGRENAREFLENNPEMAREVDRKIREARGLLRVSEASVASATPPPAPEPATVGAGRQPVRARG